IARKHPYSVRKVAPNLRNSLLEYVRQDEAVGKQVLALEEDMTVDVLGALNLGSGTFAVWLRPGGKFYAGTTLFSVGNYDVWITRGEPMWSLKTQTGEGGKKELVFIGGNWAEI